MRVLAISIALSLGLATCPAEERRPDPRPYPRPAGAAGAPDGGAAGHKTGGAGGSPSAGTGGAWQGGSGGYAPGGSGGAPQGGLPLCTLPPSTWPQPDAAVEATRRDLEAGLEKTGGGSPSGWLVYRDFTGAYVVTLPPVGAEPPWDAARLGLVLAWMPGGGHVEVGVSSPCPAVPERQTAIVRGVAMPSGRARR
jgi:hypothetical protein